MAIFRRFTVFYFAFSWNKMPKKGAVQGELVTNKQQKTAKVVILCRKKSKMEERFPLRPNQEKFIRKQI